MARLVLASTSEIRRLLLSRAGLEFEAMAPDVDEASLKASRPGHSPRELATFLAEAKAVSLTNRIPDAIILGSDQVLNLAGAALDKPATLAAARRQLEQLRGREHWLETAVCCAFGEKVVWRHHDRARLVMRQFSDRFLADYLERMGAEALSSVGAYKLEGLGIQLFETIEGDYFTILGLPLLPLLAFLRSKGAAAS